MNTIYPRPDWTFRPTSKADFSERAKNVSRLLEQPLQKTQEFLARVFGFQDLHALQAELLRVEDDPVRYPPGPFIDNVGLAILSMNAPEQVAELEARGVKVPNGAARDNHLLTATAEFCFGDPQATLAERHWDIREIDLFGTLDQHRVSFAEVRDKWRVLEQRSFDVSSDVTDYALLCTRHSGRQVLEFTPIGLAIYDALRDIGDSCDRDDRLAISPEERVAASEAALKRVSEIASAHPRNPWPKAHMVFHGRKAASNVHDLLHLASDAFELFNELFHGEPEKALPRNLFVGRRVDNSCFHFLLIEGSELAEMAGKKMVARRWSALARKIARDEPYEVDEVSEAVISLANSHRQSHAPER